MFSCQEIVDEIDEDGSGELEFPEFIQLAAKFLIEEDEEQMKWELREAFRIYDKHGKQKMRTICFWILHRHSLKYDHGQKMEHLDSRIRILISRFAHL